MLLNAFRSSKQILYFHTISNSLKPAINQLDSSRTNIILKVLSDNELQNFFRSRDMLNTSTQMLVAQYLEKCMQSFVEGHLIKVQRLLKVFLKHQVAVEILKVGFKGLHQKNSLEHFDFAGFINQTLVIARTGYTHDAELEKLAHSALLQ
jgi:hypothetical protein